ncbi:ABC transporter ATP-binding protein [Streptomyces sp. NBC_00114]|nr:ABC transporter ATP-binding protein [Streptomyces sp. NBC_00078]MCX5422390.1 ABC transporter ATP-binding protein [Streptomyces sp. NBC_00078]
MVLSLASAAGTLALPLLVRDLVVALTEDDGLLGAVARMAALALAAALASALSGYLLARAGEGMVAGIRSAVVGHVLRMRLRDVRREGTGNLVARVSSDSSQLRSVVDVGAAQLPSSAVLVAGTLVVMGFLDWVLLLVVASTFAVAAAGIGLSMRTLRQGVERQQSAIGRMSQQLTAALIALPTIKAFRAERQMAGELSGSISGAERAAVSVARTQALTGPVMQLGQQVAIVGTMVASGVRLGSGALTAGEFAAFLVYLLQLISPLTMLIAGVARMQTGLAARGRLASVLTEPTEYDDREGGAELIPAAGADVAARRSRRGLRGRLVRGRHGATGRRPRLLQCRLPRSHGARGPLRRGQDDAARAGRGVPAARRRPDPGPGPGPGAMAAVGAAGAQRRGAHRSAVRGRVRGRGAGVPVRAAGSPVRESAHRHARVPLRRTGVARGGAGAGRR